MTKRERIRLIVDFAVKLSPDYILVWRWITDGRLVEQALKPFTGTDMSRLLRLGAHVGLIVESLTPTPLMIGTYGDYVFLNRFAWGIE